MEVPMHTDLKPGDTVTPANFDHDFSPDHEVNKRAAKARGVKYNRTLQAYTDVDGCLIYDKFGQSL
jgi:hypothetical protein